MDSPAGEELLFPDLVVAAAGGGGGRCPPLFPLAPRHLADLPPTTVFMAASTAPPTSQHSQRHMR